MNYRHLLLATSLLSSPAFANDSMAVLSTGGLVLTRSEAIEMKKEDLYISPEKVEVNYVFHNSGDQDITTYVAFPMPEIKGSTGENVAYSDYESENFLGFAVEQDGKPVDVSLQQRVFAAGIDRTEDLKKYNIPFMPLSEKASSALNEMSVEAKYDFIMKGLVTADMPQGGDYSKAYIEPRWVLNQTYYWKTTFPAGKDVKVRHTYTPSVGGYSGISFLNEDGEPNEEYYDDYVKKYCMDDDFVEIARQGVEDMKNGKPFYWENWISYILVTAGNWGTGSIGEFRLTIDKGKADSVVSFCGDGVKKIGPTTFEITAKDYYPEKNLDILILDVHEALPN